MRLFVFPSEEEWLEAASLDFVEAALNSREEGRAACHFCLAGGTTPAPLYRRLASEDRVARAFRGLDVHLWLGDERVVPKTAPERNGEMVREAFAASLWPYTLHVWPEGKSPEAYGEELAGYLGASPVFDLTFLGIGLDGHTAGLFPDDPGVRAALDSAFGQNPGHSTEESSCDTTNTEEIFRNRSSAWSTIAPQEPRDRLSLSPMVLAASRRIRFLTRGTAKFEIVKELAAGGSRYPAAFLDSERSAILHLASD